MSNAALHAGLPVPGQLLLGKYRVERVLGEGGMGIVLAALHVQLNEPVAIKLLHPDLGLTGSRYARFVREARAAGGIRSEHVVRVFDLGALENGAPYIAMEFLRGTDLSSLVATRGPLPIADAVDYLLQACEGIAEAHARQIIHRDLKPANLFLTQRSDGSACVKVLDFGISKVGESAGSPSEDDGEPVAAGLSATVDGSNPGTTAPTVDRSGASGGAPARGWSAMSLTRTRGRLGSPKYMSPEQTRSAKHVDARADIWALGTILYELLTGTAAFDADTAEALSVRIATVDPPSARGGRPEIPEALEGVIRRCLCKRPEDRFGDVGELATSLAAFASPDGASSALRAAKILRRAEGGSLIPAPRVDVLGPTVDASTGGTRKAGRSRGRRWARIGAAIVGGLVVLFVGARLGFRGWLSMRANRSAAEASGSRMSSSPEAVAAYETGMRALRDGSLSTAVASLDRATALDPSFAAAHLGRAFVETVDWSRTDTKIVQEHLGSVRSARDALGERDKLLFDALEPWASVPPNLQEAARRLERATSGHRTDATLRFALTVALDGMDSPAAVDSAQLTLVLDPSFAMAWDVIAHLREVDDVQGAIDAEKECLEISPGADTCMWRLAVIQSGLGKCADVRATTQRILALTPGSARAYRVLAGALAATGEPLDAVRFALEKRWALLPSEEAPASRAEDEAALAILAGDLSGAEEKYRTLERLKADAPDESSHFPGTYGRMLVEIEAGRKTEAAAAAAAYLSRRAAWSTDLKIPRTISIYALQRAAGAISEAKFEELRDRWLTQETERRRTFGLIPAVDYGWTLAYTQAVETREEALDVLATRGDAGRPFFEVASAEPDYDEWIGRVYLLAGKLDDAVAFLGRASGSCAVLAPRQTLFVLRASAELGEALEARGDTAGACAAYRKVLSRWGGGASPPLLTAKVQARFEALACAR